MEGRIEMAAWRESDRETCLERGEGGEAERATASSVLHKAKGHACSTSLSLSLFSHDSY